MQEAIDRAMKGRTVLVIAHRLSTVRTASLVRASDHVFIIKSTKLTVLPCSRVGNSFRQG